MKHLFLLVFASFVVSASAQTVATYFTKMPAELLPGITVDTRKDLIDFYQYGKLAVMPSAFGGKIQLKRLQDDYLLLQTSANGDLQIKLLTTNENTPVLAVVQTVAGPLRDSRVRFFDRSWKLLTEPKMPLFALNDFINRSKAAELGLTDRLAEIGPRLFVAIAFRPGENAFVASSSLKEDMEKAQSEQLGALVRDSLVYRWKDNRFQAE